jgi:hypothetical protein
VDEILELAKTSINRDLRSMLRGRTNIDGPVDERWYWAAPLLLDGLATEGEAFDWLKRAAMERVWFGEEARSQEAGESSLAEALAEAREIARDPHQLGRAPDDLADVLATLALCAPGVCVLRSFARIAGGVSENVWDAALRDGAAHAAWGFRSLFNTPEVIALLRDQSQQDDAYWRRVLEYCLNGNLQSVMDEYVHTLRESEALFGERASNIGPLLGCAIHDALTLRAASYHVDDVRLSSSNGVEIKDARYLRARYAVRFGAQKQEVEGAVHRAEQVRAAFNSPFWPFVLATTSVGQEGLDFHHYCHAVVHWNLPANPVDLEQREGRVHRYKGHAVRKNVASANRQAAMSRGGGDPWERMFESARRGRDRHAGDLVPYWVYSAGDARIERYVPALPLSREIEKLEQLKRSVAVYRLAFGQPRQDDLTAYLSGLPEDQQEKVAAEIRIDLSPR